MSGRWDGREEPDETGGMAQRLERAWRRDGWKHRNPGTARSQGSGPSEESIKPLERLELLEQLEPGPWHGGAGPMDVWNRLFTSNLEH